MCAIGDGTVFSTSDQVVIKIFYLDLTKYCGKSCMLSNVLFGAVGYSWARAFQDNYK